MASSDDVEIEKKYRIKNRIFIDPEMFYSEAFKGLSKSAMITLMRCLQKRKWAKIKRNGRKQIVYTNEGFFFPYSEAYFLGIGTTQHWKNIKTLVELGFLDIAHQGGHYQKGKSEKDYSEYKMSDRWRDYGTAHFKRIEKKKVLDPGYYILKNVEKKNKKATS
jgi:hypothetical protein